MSIYDYKPYASLVGKQYFICEERQVKWICYLFGHDKFVWSWINNKPAGIVCRRCGWKNNTLFDVWFENSFGGKHD